jgi:hypothetical protein
MTVVLACQNAYLNVEGLPISAIANIVKWPVENVWKGQYFPVPFRMAVFFIHLAIQFLHCT